MKDSHALFYPAPGFQMGAKQKFSPYKGYRHGHPNPESHSTMRVRIRVPMSLVFKNFLVTVNFVCFQRD